MWKLSLAGLVLIVCTSVPNFAPTNAFSVTPCSLPTRQVASSALSMTRTTDSNELSSSSTATTRRKLLQSSSGAAFLAAAACLLPSRPAMADVADGSALPQGAAQFSRILRLKTDLKAIEKRVFSKASEIDSKEWDDLGQFLRRIYLVGDDMKVVAGGIYDPDQKKRAEEAMALLKRYAQAGDIAVNKQDPDGFVLIVQKLEGQVEDFLDSLRDVPDEI